MMILLLFPPLRPDSIIINFIIYIDCIFWSRAFLKNLQIFSPLLDCGGELLFKPALRLAPDGFHCLAALSRRHVEYATAFYLFIDELQHFRSCSSHRLPRPHEPAGPHEAGGGDIDDLVKRANRGGMICEQHEARAQDGDQAGEEGDVGIRRLLRMEDDVNAGL
jgi:hypothetical protein